MPLIASARLAELLVGAGHVEDVVDDLEQDTQLIGETAVRNCLSFRHLAKNQDHAHAGGDQAAGLERVQLGVGRGLPVAPSPLAAAIAGDVDVLAADHSADPGRGDQLPERGQNRAGLALPGAR